MVKIWSLLPQFTVNISWLWQWCEKVTEEIASVAPNSPEFIVYFQDFDKDVNRLSELVKANIQRSKIIKDQMVEARSQMHKLFDHKGKIVDIMNKYSSKRSLRKKEKSWRETVSESNVGDLKGCTT